MEYNKLTERAQVVILEAENESEKFKHGYVGTEHMLLGILKEDGYSAKLLKKHGVDSENITTMIQRYLGYGDIKKSDDNILLTPRTKRVVDESFAAAKKLNHKYVSPEHILLALLNQEEGMAYTILKSLNLNFTIISEELLVFLSGTYEDKVSDGKTIDNSKKQSTPMLDKYGRDLTALSKEQGLDPVIGRDTETQRLLEILCRRIKNNPCLIGEPGVGKTAVVEGLAQRIVEGNIPEILKNKRVISLDLTSMVAGAKYRGEFEERLKKTMEEIVKDKNIIIFIDEIHTIIGAGGAEGAIDASNILKPSLARGEMQLGQGPAQLRQEEDRVVAETARPPGLVHDPAGEHPRVQAHLAGFHPGGEGEPSRRRDGPGEGDHAPEARRTPLRGDVPELAQQLGVVVRVGAARARPAGGVDARCPVQGVHLEPGVVGQGGEPGEGRHPARLLLRVPLQGRGVLLHIDTPRMLGGAAHLEPQVGQDGANLLQLVGVPGRDAKPPLRQAPPPRARRWRAKICASPPRARSSKLASSASEKGWRSAVPCSSMKRPDSAITTFMSTLAVESSA